MTAATDTFSGLARYYDAIMAHVDYDRWFLVTTTLSGLLPEPFIHLDTACGTCTLLNKLRRAGWSTVGLDLSHDMVREGQKGQVSAAAGVGDLRALPVRGTVDYATCLFDSVNFMLTVEDMRRAIAELSGALGDGGLLYFDVVTERMVLDHFAGQKWTEKEGNVRTTWECTYNHKTSTAETRIQVNSHAASTIYERIFERDIIEQAVADAGLELLGVFDAEGWRAPSKRTIRMDFVAVKGSAHDYKRAWKDVRKRVQRLFK
jgi:SAM-dependent methyltransferase